jgi:hypothetical protein
MIEEAICVGLSPAGTINRWATLTAGTPAGVEIPVIGPVVVPAGDQHHLTDFVSQVAKGADGTLFRVYKKLAGDSLSFTQVDETTHPDYGTKNVQWGTAMRFLEGESWKVTAQQSTPGRLSLKVNGQAKKFDVINGKPASGLLDQLFIAGEDFHLAAFDGAVRPNYGECVLAAHPTYTPSWRNGAIAGMKAAPYRAGRLAQDMVGPMLGYKFVGLTFGLSDIIAGTSQGAFCHEMYWMLTTLVAAGFTPVVPTLPYIAQYATQIASFNNDLRNYSAQFSIPQGPDLYNWFVANPSGVTGSNPVIPTSQGAIDTVRLWAQAMDYLYT